MKHLLLILLLTITSVTAKAEAIVEVKKSQPAPFKGVLMPDSDFKTLVIAEKQVPELEQALQTKSYQLMVLQEESQTKQNWFFAAGVLLGGFIGWQVAK